MIKISKIQETQFKNDKFDTILGTKRTYNEYFEITIDSMKLKIGLQTITGGINPNVKIFGEKTILVNGGKEFFILENNGKVKKIINSEMIFYDFRILSNKILLIGETELILLNNNGDLIWNKTFRDIIISTEIRGTDIFIRDFENNLIIIDLNTAMVSKV